MSDLAAFLLARVAEREVAARACLAAVGATRAGEPYPDGSGVADRDDFPSYPWGSGEAELAYLASVHPARILADCEAIRRVVEWCEALAVCNLHDARRQPGCEECAVAQGVADADERILRALVAPYADHPGFREEWAL